MNTTIKLRKAQVKKVLEATFPNYRGRTYEITFQNKITFHDTNWGGGTKNEYRLVRSDGKTAGLPVSAPWANPVEGKTVEIPEDVLVVCNTVFCGKKLGITIYANTCHLPMWLEA